MFFIYSSDNYLIKKQVEKITKKLTSDQEYEIYTYSLIDHSIRNIDEQAKTYSLFNTKKLIIINDCWFMNESKVKLNSDFDLKYIENFLELKSNNVTFIYTLNSEKISKRLKIVKLFENRVKIIKLDQPTFETKKELVIKKLTTLNKEFEEDAILAFLELIPIDMSIFSNELNKLLSIEKKITKEVINSFFNKYMQYDTFEIANAFLTNDIKKFLKSWKDYSESNKDIFGFLMLIANSFIILRNAIILKEEGQSNSQIASYLSQNPYRIQKLMEQNKWDITQINDKIKLLYILDKSIKEGIIDNKIIPSVMLLKMFV